MNININGEFLSYVIMLAALIALVFIASFILDMAIRLIKAVDCNIFYMRNNAQTIPLWLTMIYLGKCEYIESDHCVYKGLFQYEIIKPETENIQGDLNSGSLNSEHRHQSTSENSETGEHK